MSLPPLRESQAAAVVEMLARPHLGVFLPMGFGKTRATIEALSLSGWPRTLIVATKRIVANVWPQEFDRWADKETREDRTAQHVKADEVSFSLRYHTVRATKATRSNIQAHEADDTREG